MNVYIGELYKEVEYIQSSGTQYIDTGIKGDISSNLSVDYKFTLVQNKSSGQQSIFGNIGSNGQGLAIYWDANSNQQGTWCGTGTGWYPGYITVGSATTINATFNKTSGRTFSINGTTYTNSASNPSIDNGLNYFIFNDGRSSLAGYFKIYYFKIYKDGTLVRNFIPCYRVSDNVIGLFDKVENKFYTNAGTGSFTKGNDVGTFQPELKNAYIGEVWTPGSNTIAYFPLAEDQLDKSGNGYTLTTAGTKQTIGYQFSGSNIQINGTSDVANMMSVWIKIVSFGSGIGDSATMIRIGGAMRYNWYHSTSSSNKKFQIYNSSSSSQIYSSAQNTNTGNRYHLLFGVSGTTNGNYVGWINGNKVFSGTTNTNLGGGDWLIKIINNNTTLIASDLIVENRVWTDAEVLNYYNLTKSNYGI